MGSIASSLLGGGGIKRTASTFSVRPLFILAAFILALTLAASASRSVAASLAAMDAMVRGLCCGRAFSLGLGNLLEAVSFNLEVELGFLVEAGREDFFGDDSFERFDVFSRETSSEGDIGGREVSDWR